jgi:hypothetical protein
MNHVNIKTPDEIAAELRKGGMQCNCDLDNWIPEATTGHSWVCDIHKKAMAEWKKQPDPK